MSVQLVSELVRDQELFALPGNATVSQAIQLMQEKDVGAIIILDDGRLTGIFTERDLAREEGGRSFNANATLLSEVMTPNPDTISRDASGAQALASMDAGGYRHLPVVDGKGDVVGIVSRSDFF